MTSDPEGNLQVVPIRRPVNENLVRLLEEQLALARSGQLVSGGFFGTLHDDTVITSNSSTSNSLLELAAVSRILHRMQLRMDRETHDVEVDGET